MATAIALSAPVLPFGPPQEELAPVAVVTAEHSIIEIDRERGVLSITFRMNSRKAASPPRFGPQSVGTQMLLGYDLLTG